jgi:hypothetical protein
VNSHLVAIIGLNCEGNRIVVKRVSREKYSRAHVKNCGGIRVVEKSRRKYGDIGIANNQCREISTVF